MPPYEQCLLTLASGSKSDATTRKLQRLPRDSSESIAKLVRYATARKGSVWQELGLSMVLTCRGLYDKFAHFLRRHEIFYWSQMGHLDQDMGNEQRRIP